MKTFECYYVSHSVMIWAHEIHPFCPHPVTGKFFRTIFIESEFDSHPVYEIISLN